MNTTTHTPCSQDTGGYFGRHMSLRKLLDKLRTSLARPAIPDAVSGDDPWSTAVNQVEHLDAHVLADIGAPRWVIDEVGRRQRHDDILDLNRKW